MNADTIYTTVYDPRAQRYVTSAHGLFLCEHYDLRSAERVTELLNERGHLRRTAEVLWADQERLDWLTTPEGLAWAGEYLRDHREIDRVAIDAAIKAAKEPVLAVD